MSHIIIHQSRVGDDPVELLSQLARAGKRHIAIVACRTGSVCATCVSENVSDYVSDYGPTYCIFLRHDTNGEMRFYGVPVRFNATHNALLLRLKNTRSAEQHGATTGATMMPVFCGSNSKERNRDRIIVRNRKR